MSNILIITDQPVYDHNENLIAGPTISVTSVFSGDIIDSKLDAMNKIHRSRFDSILLPITIIEYSPHSSKIMDLIDALKNKDESLKIHFYENKY